MKAKITVEPPEGWELVDEGPRQANRNEWIVNWDGEVIQYRYEGLSSLRYYIVRKIEEEEPPEFVGFEIDWEGLVFPVIAESTVHAQIGRKVNHKTGATYELCGFTDDEIGPNTVAEAIFPSCNPWDLYRRFKYAIGRRID